LCRSGRAIRVFTLLRGKNGRNGKRRKGANTEKVGSKNEVGSGRNKGRTPFITSEKKRRNRSRGDADKVQGEVRGGPVVKSDVGIGKGGGKGGIRSTIPRISGNGGNHLKNIRLRNSPSRGERPISLTIENLRKIAYKRSHRKEILMPSGAGISGVELREISYRYPEEKHLELKEKGILKKAPSSTTGP